MFATSKEDVIAAVKFSKEHNMNLKVISSGQFVTYTGYGYSLLRLLKTLPLWLKRDNLFFIFRLKNNPLGSIASFGCLG